MSDGREQAAYQEGEARQRPRSQTGPVGDRPPQRQRPGEPPREGLGARRGGPPHLSADPARKQGGEKDVEWVLARMEAVLRNARKVPLSELCLIDRGEFLYLIDLMRRGLPEEIRTARWIIDQAHNLTETAKKDADAIRHEAKQTRIRLANEHEITQLAQEEAQRMIEEASGRSRDINDASMNYVRKQLVDLENHLTEILLFVQKNKQELDQA